MLIEPRGLRVLALAVLLTVVVAAGVSSQRPSNEPPDVVLRNGRVYTADPQRPEAEVVAIRDGRILYVGSDAGLSSLIDGTGDTTVIDLNGRMVLPGFVDGHNHAYLRAEALNWVTLSGSLDDYQAATQRFLEQHPDAVQVRGVGFDLRLVLETAEATGRAPKLLLDDIVGRDLPAVFITRGHHQIWANSAAIEQAGVTRETPEPQGAVIERDPMTGEPTGIFREFGAQNLVIGALPQPDLTVQEYRDSVLSFQELAGERGVTSILVPVHYPSENFLKALQALDDEGRLTLRYDLALWADETRGTEQVAEFRTMRDTYGGDRFTIDSIKIFGTGVGAGTLVWEQAVLNETVAALDKEDFRVYVHVIGDAADNDAILDAFEYAFAANPRWDARHTITHVNDGASPTAPRFKALGIRADGHPVPRAFFDAGVISSASSDYPVRDFFPFVRLARGVRNGVPLDALISDHTIRGAELIFADDETGSIEVGKSADLVVLDRDLFELTPDEIEQTRVLMTLIAGQEVFRDRSFE